LTGQTRIIGLTLGLAYEKAQSHCIQNCGERNTAYSLALAQSGSSASSASTLLYRSVLPAVQQITRPTEYEYGMIDFGINWHPITTEQWDPYVGLKLGLGLCIGDYECNVIKLSPRLGARYNLDPSWYLFSEIEYQTRVFSNRSAGFDILSGPVIGPAILFGAGWHL
ncbi:MAG: hypothetical protein KDK37_10965, partial [Leptospiraceae bacterium]|nr:hypothetical protein [Leptospiraceae bacterium]